MTEHSARLSWQRRTASFDYETYDRGHTVILGSGVVIAASAAPEFKGAPDAANPEELLVAALSSCHMLSFLAIAARKRMVVDAYEDQASGTLTKNAAGRLFVSHVTLRPRVRFATPPGDEAVRRLHHQAHEECFIASSVLTKVTIEDP